MLLGDFGADIVKVEAIDGDMTRITGIMGQGENPYFVNLNRNKRDIAVNLKTDDGRRSFAVWPRMPMCSWRISARA